MRRRDVLTLVGWAAAAALRPTRAFAQDAAANWPSGNVTLVSPFTPGGMSDVLGRAREALPHYEKAIALGLPPNELSGALIGLGNTLRTLGQLERSGEVLRSGQAQFPENTEFAVFLALTLHTQGRHAEALRLTLETLCATTEDPGLTAYQRAIRHEAAKL